MLLLYNVVRARPLALTVALSGSVPGIREFHSSGSICFLLKFVSSKDKTVREALSSRFYGKFLDREKELVVPVSLWWVHGSCIECLCFPLLWFLFSSRTSWKALLICPFIVSNTVTKLQSTISNVYSMPPLPFNQKTLAPLLFNVLFSNSHHQSQVGTEHHTDRMTASSSARTQCLCWRIMDFFNTSSDQDDI